MPSHEVWFAIPSASVARCREHLPAWREQGYRVAVLQGRERGEIPADITVWSDTYNGWPDAVNFLCASVVPRRAAIVVTGGDDMLPDPHQSAEQVAGQFFERFPDGFGVMQPQGDALLGSRFFCGSPWLGRGWMDRAYGGRGPLPVGYRHNWADNELYWVARCLGRLWERPDLTQYHHHFSRGTQEAPEYWSASATNNDRHDVQLFLARAWQRFPDHQPLAVNSAATPAFDAARFEREYTGAAEAYWIDRYGSAMLTGGPAARLRDALESCHQRGKRRVALFGAGSHTRGAAAALMQPPVQVLAIIDENPGTQGTSLWNIPVMCPRTAAALRLDAVILSSRTMEDELVRSCGPLTANGAEIVRLYGPAGANEPATAAQGPALAA